MKSWLHAKYVKLLQRLCRRELKRIADLDAPRRDELVRYHDFMAIRCINAETPATEKILGISVATANMLEEPYQPATEAQP